MEIQLLNGKKMTTREEMHDYLSNKLRDYDLFLIVL